MPTRPRLPALLPLLLLAACATPPNKPFSDFDQATRKVQLSTGNTLERIQHNARLNAVLTAPNAPLNPDTFRLQTGSGASYDLAPALGQLQATLDTLALYARTLNGLAGDREAEAWSMPPPRIWPTASRISAARRQRRCRQNTRHRRRRAGQTTDSRATPPRCARSWRQPSPGSNCWPTTATAL